MKRFPLTSALIGLTVLLTACPQPQPPEPPKPPAATDPRIVPLDSTKVSGLVVGTDFALDSMYIGSTRSTFFGEILLPKNTAGTALGTLTPGSADLVTGQFVDGCTGTNSNPAARTLFNTLYTAYGTQGDLLGQVYEAVVGGADRGLPEPMVARLYADSAFSFKGSCNIKLSDGSVLVQSVDINVAKGWNALVQSGTGLQSSLKNASADDQVTLTFLGIEPEVAVVIEADPVSISTDQPVTVTAKLIQVGGYSGTVNLTTEFPGLSISPSSFTLPALPKLTAQGRLSGDERLGTASLKAQLVSTTLTFDFNGPSVVNAPFGVTVTDGAGRTVGGGEAQLNVARPGFSLRAYADMGVPTLVAGETQDLPVIVGGSISSDTRVPVNVLGGTSGITGNPTEVTANNAVQNIPVTVPATLAPGQYEITLMGQVGKVREEAKVMVQVLPPRTALGNLGTVPSLTSSNQGDLWGAQQGGFLKIQGTALAGRITGGGLIKHVQVGPDGSVWGSGGGLYRVEGTTVRSYTGVSSFSLSTNFTVDATGRAWLMNFDGFNQPSLVNVDPESGTVTKVATPVSANTAVPVGRSGDGQHILFIAADGRLVSVTAATGDAMVSSDRVLNTAAGEAARFWLLDRAGNVWLAHSGMRARLLRLDPVTAQVVQEVNIGNVANESGGYVQAAVESSSVAWFIRNDTLVRMNLTDGTLMETPLLDRSSTALRMQYHAIALAPVSGVAVTFGSGSTTGATSPDPEYLRVIR